MQRGSDRKARNSCSYNEDSPDTGHVSSSCAVRALERSGARRRIAVVSQTIEQIALHRSPRCGDVKAEEARGVLAENLVAYLRCELRVIVSLDQLWRDGEALESPDLPIGRPDDRRRLPSARPVVAACQPLGGTGAECRLGVHQLTRHV